MAAQELVFQKVSAVLVEALNIEETEVTPAAKLQQDLGAESIDLLDILFRLEREFGIKIPRAELFPETIFQGNPEFVQDGRVTPSGLEVLKERLQFADFAAFEQDPAVGKIGELFTVQLLTRYVQSRLGGDAPRA
jgi:acyl carrier protein